MIINFSKLTDIKEVTKFDIGVKPEYEKKGSMLRGTAWCPCGRLVGSLVLFLNGTVKGWFSTECVCGNKINWSEAKESL